MMNFISHHDRYSQMTLHSKRISKLIELNSIDMTAAMIGKRFDLENMKDSTTTDCIVDSLLQIESHIL